MSPTIATLVLAASTTIYMPEGRNVPRIEAITDHGPILEMIVKCPKGTGIISYSKIERLYCGPKGGCHRDRDTAIARLCS